jgi:hypothetical protein
MEAWVLVIWLHQKTMVVIPTPYLTEGRCKAAGELWKRGNVWREFHCVRGEGRYP